MKVWFVGAGPGDPDLITFKGKRLLESADVIVTAGSLVNPALLAWARPEAQVHDSAGMALEEILGVLVTAARAGKCVVRLATGDPSVYGALEEQREGLAAAGVEVEVVPGISSFTAAAAALGHELTAPGLAQSIVLTRAEGRTPMPERERLAEWARHRSTLVLFLSAHLAPQVQADLLTGYPPETPVVVAYKVGWPDQKLLRGRLVDLARLVSDAKIERHALLLVGQVFEATGWKSRLYDRTFGHGFRPAAGE